MHDVPILNRAAFCKLKKKFLWKFTATVLHPTEKMTILDSDLRERNTIYSYRKRFSSCCPIRTSNILLSCDDLLFSDFFLSCDRFFVLLFFFRLVIHYFLQSFCLVTISFFVFIFFTKMKYSEFSVRQNIL